MPVHWCSTSVQFYCIVANNQSNQSQKRLRGFQISVWSWVKSTAAVQGAESRSSWRPALLPSSQPSPSTPQRWWHSPSRSNPSPFAPDYVYVELVSIFSDSTKGRKYVDLISWSPDHLMWGTTSFYDLIFFIHLWLGLWSINLSSST